MQFLNCKQCNAKERNTVLCINLTEYWTSTSVSTENLILLTHKYSLNSLTAINDSCLVFDGRLVISANFNTNDEFIRAAGPLTKYQRRYHAESW